jgi:hypothetical protein
MRRPEQMSLAAAHAEKFYDEVVRKGKVFTFDDGEKYLVFPVRDCEVVPFWSSRSRCVKLQAMHSKYAGWHICEEPLEQFIEKTLKLLGTQGIQVGINWTGERLIGYDISVEELLEKLKQRM